MVLDYVKLIFVFLLLFASIFATISGATPPLFGYVLFGIVLVFGLLAIRRHSSNYVKTLLRVAITVQLVFFLALPYWLFKIDTALNLSWPYFPELLWTTGKVVVWYYAISFIFIPIVSYFFGRRAWCSFICGTGAMAETLGDQYRQKGAKSQGIPGFFTGLKWVILIVSIAFTIAALTGDPEGRLMSMIFLIVFILLLRNLCMLAGNIILMPKFGTRIWCKYFCPQGLIIGLIARFGRFAVVRDTSKCINCGDCNANCSMSINISQGPAVNPTGDCVGCGVCVEVCPKQALSLTNNRSLFNEKGILLKDS